MILVTGGAYQGKRRFVSETLGISEERALFDLHEYIRECVENGDDPEKRVFELIGSEKPDAVTCDEIGMGIVPAERSERIIREATGRIVCRIAGCADEVYRLVCGIPVKIK